MTSPTRRPVNGPGPDADADRGEVLADDPGSLERRGDERRELLAVLHRQLGDELDHDVRAVVQRDGHQRGGGVEGEQHQRDLQCVVSRPSSQQEVQRERRCGRLPDARERLGVQRHRRGDAAADEQRPAGERGGRTGCARGRPGSPTWCGCARSTASSRSGSRSRIGSISATPMSTGGWCRQTNVGRWSLSELARRARPATRRPARRGRSAPPAARRPASRASGTGRPAGRAPGRSGPVAARPSRPRANASRTSWLPVPTSRGPGQRVEDGPRLGVLLGEPVVGDVAGDEEQVGRGSSASRWSRTRSARARASGGPPKWGRVRCATRVTSDCSAPTAGRPGHPHACRDSSSTLSPRSMRTSSRDSARPSARPSPHSTTVTASSSEVSRSRSSSSSRPPSR